MSVIDSAYVARKECGCLRGIALADPFFQNGEMVAEWIDDGCTVDRILVREGELLWHGSPKCEQHRVKEGTP